MGKGQQTNSRKRQRGSQAKPGKVPQALKDQAQRSQAKPGKGLQRSQEQQAPQRHRHQDLQGALCPLAGSCGACNLIHKSYEQQLAFKNEKIKELFSGLDDEAAILPIRGMDEPRHFRSKVISPFVPGRKGDILTGMYQAGSHRLVQTEGCLVENQVANQVIQAIRSIMLRYKMQPYNEDAGTGFVRHAVVRTGHKSGEVLVTLVTNEREFPASKSFCQQLVKRVPQVTSVVQSVNTRQTNVILGDEERVLYGPGFILDTLCGLSFRVSSQSFYQTNSVQTEVLYETAIEFAQLNGTQTVLDTYCGTGTIGLVAAAHGAQRVIGVESVASAVRDARENARHNSIQNAQFVCADATEFMRDLASGVFELGGAGASSASSSVDASFAADAAGEAQSFDDAGAAGAPSVVGAENAADGARSFDSANTVFFMDPPRAGSTPEFLQAAAALGPARIVYVSCNPETQVRDIKELQRFGYRLQTVQPVDMFPHTDHVETVVLLQRSR